MRNIILLDSVIGDWLVVQSPGDLWRRFSQNFDIKQEVLTLVDLEVLERRLVNFGSHWKRTK